MVTIEIVISSRPTHGAPHFGYATVARSLATVA